MAKKESLAEELVRDAQFCSRSKYSRKKMAGSALAYALVIMTVVMILLTSIIGYIIGQIKFSTNRIEREKAFQVAEAGVYYYRWYLAHATTGMTVQQLKVFWSNPSTLGISGDYEEDYKDPETQEVVGHYTVHIDPPDPYSTIASITSTGFTYRLPETKRVVKARFRRPSWSEYIYLVNGFIRFGTGAEVYGRVHSNTAVEFNGLAHNVVSNHLPVCKDSECKGKFGVFTSVAPADPKAPTTPYPWPDGTVPNRPDVFEGGRQFPVPEIGFAGVRSNLDFMKKTACNYNETAKTCAVVNNCWSSGCYFNNTYGRRIILKTNDTMDVCRVVLFEAESLRITRYQKNSGTGWCSSCSGECAPTNYTIPDNGIIFVENNAWVEGTVNGKRITVAAANLGATGPAANIYLGLNNLKYSNSDGKDIIGIVGQQHVQIVRDCPENLIISGALIAQAKNDVGKVFRDSGAYTSDYNKDSLTINGSIASFEQPYFNFGERGFTTRTYNFDNNLLYFPPPYFPTGTEYSIDLWEEL